jgi:DNA-binding SARP family transcriptional activator
VSCLVLSIARCIGRAAGGLLFPNRWFGLSLPVKGQRRSQNNRRPVGTGGVRDDQRPMIGDVGSGPARAEVESLLAMGERALHVNGDLVTARPWFTRAYALAEEVGAGRLMAAAALGLSGLWVHEHRLAADAASIEVRQRTALSLLDPRSSLALRMRARLAAEADYRAGRHATILAIVEEARRSGDPVALAEALSLAHECLLGPEHADLRLGLAEELLREGSRTHRPSDVVMGLLWRTVDLFMLGEPHAERSLAELSGSGQAKRNAAVSFVVSAMRVMLSIRGGRLAEAERFAQNCTDRGRVAGDADPPGWYGAQLVAIRWYQGRIGELVGPLAEIANSPVVSAVDNAFLAGLAVAAATAGDRRQACGALARIRGSDLGQLPRSSSWLAAMNAVVETAALLDDADTAARAYALLLPYARLPIMASLGGVCFGSTHHPLGVASLTTGEPSRAVEHFRTAIEQNTALGHWPAAVLSRHRLAQALALRGNRGDVESADAERAVAAQEATSLEMMLPATVVESVGLLQRQQLPRDVPGQQPGWRCGTAESCTFGILGPIELNVGGHALPLTSTKVRCLLAALLVSANRVVSTDRLIDALWHDNPPRSAVKNLHQYVYRLRRLLPDHGVAGYIARYPAGYMLVVRPDELDTDRFEAFASAARQSVDIGDDERAARYLTDALSLWRGVPLADVRESPVLEDAARPIEERRLQVLEERIRLDLGLGRHERLLPELEALVREHPLRERLREHQMLALYACGRRADALHVFQDIRVLLAREVGIDPGPALRELADAILTDDASRVAAGRTRSGGQPMPRSLM